MSFYAISPICPSGGMGGYGFSIHLAPSYRQAVSLCDIDETVAQRIVDLYREQWLSHTGYRHLFDPENCTAYANPYAVPSTETKLSGGYPRIRWGEWGLEVIEVPGSASGLYLKRDPINSVFQDGVSLHPHNMDCWNQINLVLCVFTQFTNHVILDAEYKTRERYSTDG